MTRPIIYRELHTQADFQAVMRLQAAIWAMQPAMLVPTHMLHALTYGGGCLIGAELDGEVIGFVLGFLARRDGQSLLWSHMAGVLPAYQGRSIGRSLKFAQRDWALQAGYDTIAWTFDPLQSGNARFNLCKLRATAAVYHADFYGDMPDDINAGLPSDRLEIRWALNAPRVRALDNLPEPPAVYRPVPPEHCALYLTTEGDLCARDVDSLARECFVEIPADLARLKNADFERARAWQSAVRTTLTHLFRSGYTATDFRVDQGHHYYVLTNRIGAHT